MKSIVATFPVSLNGFASVGKSAVEIAKKGTRFLAGAE